LSENDRLKTIEAIKELTSIGSFKANILYDAGYTSVDKLKEASVEDLTAIKGISKSYAKKILTACGFDEEKEIPELNVLEQTEPVEDGGEEKDEDEEDPEAAAIVSWEGEEEDEAIPEAQAVEEEWAEKKKEDMENLLQDWSTKQQEYKKTHPQNNNDKDDSKEDMSTHNLAIYETAMETAWSDGLISEDERSMLESLRQKLNISGDQHFEIENNIRKKMAMTAHTPGAPVEAATPPETAPEAAVEDDLMADIQRAEQAAQAQPAQKQEQQPAGHQKAFEQYQYGPDPEAKATDPQKKSLITLTSSRRSSSDGPVEFHQVSDAELAAQAATQSISHIECPKCGSAVPVTSTERPLTVQCPSCGAKGKLEIEDTVTEADLAQLNYLSIEEILAMADEVFKKAALNKAFTYYSKVLQLDPTHKKAQFFQKKIKAMLSKKVEDKRVKVRQITTMPTGVRRLDDLSGRGGIPYRSNVMLLGPSFIGKETLMTSYIVSGLTDNIPVIVMLTNKSPEDVKQAIAYMLPNYVEYERKGLIHYIDAYSATMGIFKKGASTNITTLKDVSNTDDLLNNIARVQQDVNKRLGPHRFVFYSLSNVLTHIGIQKTLLFLQTLVARNNEYRATSIYDLAKGIHSGNDITAIEYQMDGIIEFKSEENRNFLKLRGLGEDVKTRDWVEYKFNKKELSIVGSFTMEYIA
jgi:KaiC/GvpD/RAD55 family RecA-like ATPase/ribosomal protein S13